MKKMYNMVKKEVIIKLITSLFLEGLTLIIPIFWSKCINYISDGNIKNAYYLVIVTLILSLFYYLWCYLNQKAWYLFYNKLYLLLSKRASYKKQKVCLGEYTNILNNDIDIVCTFYGNFITRVIQIIEFLVIYIYFLNINFYIFILSVIVSFLMVMLILRFNSMTYNLNFKRKENLDIKSSIICKMHSSTFHGNIHSNYLESTFNYLYSNSTFNIFVNSCIYIILSFIEFVRYLVIFYAIYLVSINSIELGTVLLIYSYYGRMITNFEVLTSVFSEYQSVKVSLERINKLNV